MLVASCILICVSGLIGQFPDFRKRWKAYLFLGVFNILIPFALATYSVMLLNASFAAILGATVPLFAVVAAKLWLNEKITVHKVSGIVISVAGLVIFMGTNPFTIDAGFWLAVLAGLAGSFSYAASSVYAGIKFECSNPVQTASGQIILASALILPFFINNIQPALIAPGIIWPLLFLGVVSTAGGYILYFKLIASAGSVHASFVTILVPVFGVLWASVFLHEMITGTMLVGLALVVSGIFLVVHKKRRRYATVLKPIRGAKFYEEFGYRLRRK